MKLSDQWYNQTRLFILVQHFSMEIVPRNLWTILFTTFYDDIHECAHISSSRSDSFVIVKPTCRLQKQNLKCEIIVCRLNSFHILLFSSIMRSNREHFTNDVEILSCPNNGHPVALNGVLYSTSMNIRPTNIQRTILVEQIERSECDIPWEFLRE